MLAIAVVVCTFFLQREARRRGYAPEFISDLVFWAVLGGILGGRIFYVFLNLSFFVGNPLEFFMLHHGGLAWQGAFAFGLAAVLLFLKLKKVAIVPVFDLAAPYLALGQAIGRLGCFLNGCCHGREVSWGIYFPVYEMTLHPTQLYDSLGLLLIFWTLKHLQKKSPKPGVTFCAYLMLAPALRFAVQFFRADYQPLWAGLSIFQWISVLFAAVAFYAYLYFQNR